MSRRADTPRDLLFGLLALQTGMIDQSALVIGFLAWTQAKGRPMAEILVEHGVIDLQQRLALESLAELHLKKHGGDAEKSLAAIGVGSSTRQKLADLANTDLDRSLDSVGTAVPPEDDPYATASHAVGTSTSGGQRFRVLRPHAKGGLGAVFVALDAELNREVALKEILDHHADNPAYQSKFLIEAEITGGLEHPGIVPVYGLGHYDDGRPYYAMRFIKGDNLKQAIEHFHSDETLKADPGARSLALRKLLRRFTDVCNAIEYAHSRGVLHRDIKPGNVIVGKYGETLVVDWGLAKAQGRSEPESTQGERALVLSSASGSVETLPGHAIGTPAYMSPEQAVGDLDRLGPRSDVYSLGATLYSLLTGKIPFEGNIGDVLNNVQDGRFPRPRVIDPTIDPALEALCLKAMAKSPEVRYASPKALAEDLDRWAADEPVSAWKEPLPRRARRWARRHRTGVTATSAAVLALLIGLAGVLAVQSKAKSDLLTVQSKAKSDLETKNKLLADASEKIEARYDLAQESIQTFRTTVTEEQIFKDEQFHTLRNKLLRSAADFYDKLGKLLVGQTDRRSQLALANAYRGLGELTDEIGVKPESLAVFRKELLIRRELARQQELGAVLALAKNFINVARLTNETGDSASAMESYKEGSNLLKSESWPPELASQMGIMLATIHNDLGSMMERRSELPEAMESYVRAQVILERLSSVAPTVAEVNDALAGCHNNIGTLFVRTGESAKALKSFERALAIKARLASANPNDTKMQASLARSHNNIGFVLERTGEAAKAMASYGRARAILERLESANHAVTEFQIELAMSHYNIGSLLEITGEPARAMEAHGRALAIRERLASANPDVTEIQVGLASSHSNIGFLLARTGEWAKALEPFGRALAIQDRLASANPTVTEFQSHLARCYSNIGAVLDHTNEPAKAMEAHGRALAIKERLASANPTITEFQGELALSLNNIGSLLGRTGEPAKAMESLGRALTIQEHLAAANPLLTQFQADVARSHNNIGLLLGRMGESAKALESHSRALAIRERLASANPTIEDYQKALRDSLINVGLTADRLSRVVDAIVSLRRGITLGERLARQPSEFYNLACYQSRLSGAASSPGSGLSPDEARAEADRAMAMLRGAVASGYRDIRSMRANVDLDPVRSRRDFQELLMDLAFPANSFAN